MRCLIGIEIGTTRVKTGLYDTEGNQIVETALTHFIKYDEKTSMAESSAATWWTSVRNSLRKILSSLPDAEIEAICVGSHGPSLVALDKNFNPVGNSVLWMDKRASKEAEFLSRQLGLISKDPAWFIPKAMFLKNNSPDSFKRVKYFVQPLDYINYKLTGNIRTSIVSETIKIWDEKTIKASELHGELFPEEVIMGSTVGYTSRTAKEETLLPEGIPVIGGTGGADFIEVLLSSGSLKKGIVCDRGGTSEGVNICWDKPVANEIFFQAPHPLLKDMFHISGLMATTGKALHWYKNLYYGKNAHFERFFEDAAKSIPGSKKLIFLPYLAGERTPWWNSDARGVFFGLSLEHTKYDIIRSILEGTAFGVNHILRLLKASGVVPTEIRTCGGQAKSPLWNQIKADITGLPVVTNSVTDGSTLGLAIIAGFGIGIYPDMVKASSELVKPARIYEPDSVNHKYYCQMQEIYESLYPALKKQFNALSDI